MRKGHNPEKTLSRKVQGAMENTPANNAVLRGEKFTTSIGNALSQLVDRGPYAGDVERTKDIFLRSVRQALFSRDPEGTIPPFDTELSLRDAGVIDMAMQDVLAREMVTPFLKEHKASSLNNKIIKDLDLECPPMEELLSPMEYNLKSHKRLMHFLPKEKKEALEAKIDPRYIDTEITFERLLAVLSKNLSEELKKISTSSSSGTFWENTKSTLSWWICDQNIFSDSDGIDQYWYKEAKLSLAEIIRVDEVLEEVAISILRTKAKEISTKVFKVIVGDSEEILKKSIGENAK